MIDYEINRTTVFVNLKMGLREMRLIAGVLDGVANSVSDDDKYVAQANDTVLYGKGSTVELLRDISNRFDEILGEANDNG